jgi:hypothetical protein
MNPQQKTLKRLSPQQMALYEIICETKYIRAAGSQIMTCRVLQSTGLIKHSPDSDNANDYVLDGEPVKLPPKVASPKEVAKSIVDEPTPAVLTGKSEPELKHVPVEVKPFVRARADHTNISREQHVDYWLNYAI